MNNTIQPQLVLRAYTENSYGYAHVKFYPMIKQPDGKIEGIGCGDHFGKLYIRDLIISDQIDANERSEGSPIDYAWEVCFASHAVRLSDAQGMVKTLTLIDKKSDQLRESFGYCTDYGQFVCRVANCLGAVAIVFDSLRYQSELQELAPGRAIDRINQEVAKLSRKLKGLPENDSDLAVA